MITVIIGDSSQSLCFQGWLLTVLHGSGIVIGEVSIPLFSGLVTDGTAIRNVEGKDVSIPLFSGLVTDEMTPTTTRQHKGLNPFVFRAGY